MLGALDAVVGDDDVVINAAGSLPGDLHKLWRARSPRQYHLEYGYSCMGYEIPAAIGVQLAAPGPPGVGAGRRRHVPDDADRDRHRRPGGHRRSTWSSSRTTATPPSAACPSRSGGERFGTAYRYRAADGTYTGDPLPVDLAANAASLGHGRPARRRPWRELRAALAEARAVGPSHLCLRRDRNGRHSVGRAPAQAWWDVPVAETATRPSAVKAREEYERHAADAARRHL